MKTIGIVGLVAALIFVRIASSSASYRKEELKQIENKRKKERREIEEFNRRQRAMAGPGHLVPVLGPNPTSSRKVSNLESFWIGADQHKYKVLACGVIFCGLMFYVDLKRKPGLTDGAKSNLPPPSPEIDIDLPNGDPN